MDIYSFGVILFELFYIFKTQIERIKVLTNIQNEHIEKYTRIDNIIHKCVNELEYRYDLEKLKNIINTIEFENSMYICS